MQERQVVKVSGKGQLIKGHRKAQGKVLEARQRE